MNPEAPPSMPPETPIVGYCRACGKALDSTSVHNAHGTIYCAEHVPAENASNGALFPILLTPALIRLARLLPFPAPMFLRESRLFWG